MMKKQIRSFEADGIYAVQSCSSANSLYFQNKQNLQLFMHFIDRYLSDILEIIHYVIVPTGWILLIKIKSRKEVSDAYFNLRAKSKRAILGCHKKLKANIK